MNRVSMDALDTVRVSATDQVFNILYNAVVTAKLQPGAKISEGEIAKQLGVSRQPVRDAFFRLSELGFISVRPQRATLITHISKRAVFDAVFTRTALEVECLRTAMRLQTHRLHDSLRNNIQEQRKAASASDVVKFHAADEAFHETICDLAGHSHVWFLIREQKAHLDRIRFLTLSDERKTLVIDEHQRILDAIASGDDGRAERVLREHIEGVKPVFEEIQQRYPTYFKPST